MPHGTHYRALLAEGVLEHGALVGRLDSESYAGTSGRRDISSSSQSHFRGLIDCRHVPYPPPPWGEGSLGPESIENTRRRRNFLQGAGRAEADLHCDTIVQFCGAIPPPPVAGNRHDIGGGITRGGGQQKQSNDPGNNQHILNTPIIGRR